MSGSLHAQFVEQMRVGTGLTDSALANGRHAFNAALQRSAHANALAGAYPRQMSRAGDARVEQLVQALEQTHKNPPTPAANKNAPSQVRGAPSGRACTSHCNNNR